MTTASKKPIRLSRHAVEQCAERGTNPAEIERAIREGVREPAKRGRWLYRYNLAYNRSWQDHHFAIKQVAPVVAETSEELVVVTVYTFFF